MGFLPEAVVNYLVRLGWSHGDQEIFTRDELVRVFDLEGRGRHRGRVQPGEDGLGEPRVAEEALRREELARRARCPTSARPGCPAEDDEKLRHVCAVARERARTFGEYVQQFRYFYAPIAARPEGEGRSSSPPTTKPILEAIRDGIAALAHARDRGAGEAVPRRGRARGLGLGKVAQPVRVALTGGTASPGMYDVVQILGKDETLRRLDDALRLIA